MTRNYRVWLQCYYSAVALYNRLMFAQPAEKLGHMIVSLLIKSPTLSPVPSPVSLVAGRYNAVYWYDRLTYSTITIRLACLLVCGHIRRGGPDTALGMKSHQNESLSDRTVTFRSRRIRFGLGLVRVGVRIKLLYFSTPLYWWKGVMRLPLPKVARDTCPYFICTNQFLVICALCTAGTPTLPWSGVFNLTITW